MSGHSHNHGPSHGHGHSHTPPKDFGRAFLIGIALNTAFIAIEVIAGFFADSLSLLADAGHNLSDVLGLVLAWVAAMLAKRPASQRYTYGLKRTTILAALANALLLFVGVGGIAWEAISRLGHPASVQAGTVAWVAGIGILVNGATAMLFMSGRKDDLNVRGAFLHMAADAAVSLGVMVTGIVMAFTDWWWIDPVTSLVIVLVILVGTWGLFRESLGLSLDAVPASVDPEKVEQFLSEIGGVASIHHLHIWALSTTETALTAHIVKSDATLDDTLLATLKEEIEEHFGITHTTFQVEYDPKTACGKIS